MSTDLHPAAARLADVIGNIADDQLDGPTPCPSYTVADLLDHVSGIPAAFAGAARKDPGDVAAPGNGANLVPDWRDRLPADLHAMADAWDDPEAWSGMTSVGGVEVPGEVCGLIALDELVVHGWDLAKATGQAYAPDRASIEGAKGFLGSFASPDAPAGPEVAFGPSQDAGADATALDELVALAGRDPGWSP